MTEIVAMGLVEAVGRATPLVDMNNSARTAMVQSQSVVTTREPLWVQFEQPIHRLQPGQPSLVDNLAAAADRWRAEFAAAQTRVSVVSAGSHPLEAAMNRSLQLQAEIFRVSAGFHIGLSANQQSQGAVRTLVEKS